MTMPMGFVHGTLPAGLQILGRPWSEPTLIKIGYAYGQATLHRRPPANSADRQAWARNYWLSAAVDAPLRESRVIGMARTGNRVPQSDGLRPFIQAAYTPPKYCVFRRICPSARDRGG